MLFLLSHLVVSDSLSPCGLQHSRPLCPSPFPGICPSSSPLHQWCHSAISSSEALFSFCPQSFPTSGTFPKSWLFTLRWPNYWSFSFSISPSNEYSELTSFKIDCLISLLSKGRSGVFCSTTVRKHQSSGTLPSLWSSSHNHTWPLRRP